MQKVWKWITEHWGDGECQRGLQTKWGTSAQRGKSPNMRAEARPLITTDLSLGLSNTDSFCPPLPVLQPHFLFNFFILFPSFPFFVSLSHSTCSSWLKHPQQLSETNIQVGYSTTPSICIQFHMLQKSYLAIQHVDICQMRAECQNSLQLKVSAI